MKTEYDMIEEMTNEMNHVFEEVKLKVIHRRNKPGNTYLPWIDFSTEHLSKRLDDEWKEWKEYGNIHELIDIIAMATFIRLSKPYDLLPPKEATLLKDKEKVIIKIDIGDAQELFEILCELPYRKATSFDNTPPTEREKPVESVITQLMQQLSPYEDEDDEL